MITRLRHNKIDLALHQLRAAGGEGPPLLLLHGLGERSPAALPEHLAAWPGAVHALDFTGHGDSTVPAGGGYTCELLMADADIALAEIGPSTVFGRGLGAYVALLIAGARPSMVRGAILADGPGLAGGGSTPSSPNTFMGNGHGTESGRAPEPPDPLALVELSRDIRPPDYAANFARQALQYSEASVPITVCAIGRPPWLVAVGDEPGVQRATLAEALRFYGGAPPDRSVPG